MRCNHNLCPFSAKNVRFVQKQLILFMYLVKLNKKGGVP